MYEKWDLGECWVFNGNGNFLVGFYVFFFCFVVVVFLGVFGWFLCCDDYGDLF